VREFKGKPGRKPKAVAGPGPRQTIGAAITDALGDQGALSVAEIAARIEATGRSIDKRSISYSLQAMKKQGRVKAADGNWLLVKARA
jgi:cell pole-organizing protein PopZ